MNSIIKFLVWFFLTIILISGFLITKKSFGNTLSYQYNRTFADMLIKKIEKLHRGQHIALYFKDGSAKSGEFESYNKTDESIWIEQKGWYIQDGYSIMELEDVRVLRS